MPGPARPAVREVHEEELGTGQKLPCLTAASGGHSAPPALAFSSADQTG